MKLHRIPGRGHQRQKNLKNRLTKDSCGAILHEYLGNNFLSKLKQRGKKWLLQKLKLTRRLSLRLT